MPLNKPQDLTVYVLTHDKTHFILPAFFYLFNKFWGEDQKVVVLGHSKPKLKFPKNFTFETMGEDLGVKSWTTPIYNYIKNIEDEYFMFTFDDFLPMDYLNKKIFKDLFSRMKEDKRVVKAGLGYTPSHQPDQITIIDRNKDYDVFEVNQDAPYRLSTQMGIWKKEYFLDYYKTPADPWQVEIDLSEKAKNDGGIIIGTRRKHAFRWIERTALSGKWKGKVNVLGLTKPDLKHLISKRILDPETLMYGQYQGAPFSIYGYDFKIEDLVDYYPKNYYLDLVAEYGYLYWRNQ